MLTVFGTNIVKEAAIHLTGVFLVPNSGTINFLFRVARIICVSII